MENKSDYSFQITVQTLADLIADLQENQEIKFLLPEQQQVWGAVCLKPLGIPTILIGCKEEEDIHLFNKAADHTWTGVLSTLEDTVNVFKDEIVLINGKLPFRTPTYELLVGEIIRLLTTRNMNELEINDELDDIAHFVWYDGDNDIHDSCATKVSLDENGDLDIVVRDEEGNYTSCSAYDLDSLTKERLASLKENILQTLEIEPVKELTGGIPTTITEFLNHPGVECTDPASLQFSLRIASGDYMYLESAYVGVPQEALSDNDSVFKEVEPYFNDPVSFLRDVRVGKLISFFLCKNYWYFDRIKYDFLPSHQYRDVMSTYGIQTGECTDEEQYKQLICEGYFEMHQGTNMSGNINSLSNIR